MDADSLKIIMSYLPIEHWGVSNFISERCSKLFYNTSRVEMERLQRNHKLAASNPRFEILHAVGLENFRHLGADSCVTPALADELSLELNPGDIAANSNFNYEQIAKYGPINIETYARNNKNCTIFELRVKEFIKPAGFDDEALLLFYSNNPNYLKYDMQYVKKFSIGIVRYFDIDAFKRLKRLVPAATLGSLWTLFSSNPACTIEFANEHPDEINWARFSKIVSGLDIFTAELGRWSAYDISQNANYDPWDLVLTKFYDRDGIVSNPRITLDFIRAYNLETEFVRSHNLRGALKNMM